MFTCQYHSLLSDNIGPGYCYFEHDFNFFFEVWFFSCFFRAEEIISV